MVYTVCHSTKYFKKQLYKKQNLGRKKKIVFEILGIYNICFQFSGKIMFVLICSIIWGFLISIHNKGFLDR